MSFPVTKKGDPPVRYQHSEPSEKTWNFSLERAVENRDSFVRIKSSCSNIECTASGPWSASMWWHTGQKYGIDIEIWQEKNSQILTLNPDHVLELMNRIVDEKISESLSTVDRSITKTITHEPTTQAIKRAHEPLKS